jgi:hypothetical protein
MHDQLPTFRSAEINRLARIIQNAVRHRLLQKTNPGYETISSAQAPIFDNPIEPPLSA